MGKAPYGGGGRGRLCTCRYTVTTRMIPALRWVAMRAILMFQWEVMDKVTRQCPLTNHNLFEERGEPKRYRTEVLPLHQPNALPLGQTGSHVPLPLLEFMYLVFTRMPGESSRRRIGSLLYLCDVFRALINSLVC